MMQIPPEISFYLPGADWLDAIPDSPAEFWDKYESKRGTKHYGRYSWTLKTYLYLRQFGINCNLSRTTPQNGILIAHRDFLSAIDRSGREKVLLVCIKADRETQETADIHVIQNPRDPITDSRQWGDKTYFIHYWPQEKIIPRDPRRGSEVNNIAYLGRTWNLDPGLQTEEWETALRGIGFSWRIATPDRWNDYSEIDVVVAVRNFEDQGFFRDKPASKLVNSWVAGVPAVLGIESAYRAERKSELDYLEVSSIAGTLNTLIYLKENRDVYHQMIKNGRRRARGFSPEQIAAEWERFFSDFAIPWYYRKVDSPG